LPLTSRLTPAARHVFGGCARWIWAHSGSREHISVGRRPTYALGSASRL